MNKPQGYLHSATEAIFLLLVLGPPYYHSVFYASLRAVIFYFVLTSLLLFLVKRSGNIAGVVCRFIVALCAGFVLPKEPPFGACFVIQVRVIQDPFLTPFLKRPHPSFSCPASNHGLFLSGSLHAFETFLTSVQRGEGFPHE